MNAIAITANDPLGMLGGAFPLKGTRSTPSFVNLFHAFEKPGTFAAKTGAPMTKATAASNQIAEAMIRSMLGSPVSAPVATVNASPAAPVAVSGTAAQGEGVAQALRASTSDVEATTPETMAGGDSLMRSMLGMQSSALPAPQGDDVEDAAPTAGVPLAQSMPDTEVEDAAGAEAPLPQMDNAPAADAPATPRGSMQKSQNAPRVASRAVIENPSASVAQTAPVAAPATTPVAAPKSEAAPVQSPNATRTLTVAARSTEIVEAPARQQTDDTGTVEHVAEPGTNSDAPGPIAFSLNLAPIAAQTPATTEAAAPAMQPVADSHPIVSQFKSVETQAPASEDEKTRTAAPEKSGSGNTAGRDDRSPERDALENLKNSAPQGTPVTEGAGDIRGAWTMNAAGVAVENRTDAPAVPPAAPAQPANPGPQVAEANSPVAMKPAGAAQEITVRISQPDSPVVDLHVTERGGEIHVAVRTADPELQTSLRQDLGTLTNSLERAGYHAEAFVPRASATSQTNSREERQQQQGFSGRGGSQGESGSGKQKGQREQRSASWLKELEQSK